MATYRLVGESGGTAARVSELLGLTPSDSVEAGEPIRSGRPAKLSGWSLSSAEWAEDGVELATALVRVLDQLEPVAAALWTLAREGYWANWFCYVGTNGLEHAVELDRDILTRLLAVPGELWLDVYPHYAEEEDEDEEDGEGEDGDEEATP